MAAELLALEREEQELSMLRRRLHEQLDNGVRAPNELLLARERRVSDERRLVRARIDQLRVLLVQLERS